MSLWWLLLIIPGGLIGLLLLLLTGALFSRTAVMITYNEDGIRLRIRALGIPITLYPRKEKPEKEKPKRKKEKTKKKKKQNPDKPEKPTLAENLKHSVKEMKVSDYIEIIRTVLTDFVGKFGFEKLVLHIAIGGDDAMKIAMTYGRINAALYPILGALSAANKLDRCDVQITPDFTAEEIRAEGEAIFSVRLIHALGCLLKLVNKL